MAFETLDEKAAWIDAAASLDAHQRPVQDLARRMRLSWGPSAEQIARGAHRWVRDNVRYVRDTAKVPFWRPDPAGEEFADSTTILRRGFDDCDGKARLFVALVRAVGIVGAAGDQPIEARIRPVFTPAPRRDFVHVQADARWPGSEKIDTSQPGGWLLAELILKDCPLGGDPDKMPRDASGRRVLA
jgi:hypothetical protein